MRARRAHAALGGRIPACPGASEAPGELPVVVVDVDEHPALSSEGGNQLLGTVRAPLGQARPPRDSPVGGAGEEPRVTRI